MINFFMEFEIESNLKNRYWFPIVISSSDLEEVNLEQKKYEKALTEMGFRIDRKSKPQLLSTEHWKSEFLNDYIQAKLVGRVQNLRINKFEIVAIETDPDLSFNEHLELMMAEPNKYTQMRLANKIAENVLPIRVTKEGPHGLYDHLVINLVVTK